MLPSNHPKHGALLGLAGALERVQTRTPSGSEGLGSLGTGWDGPDCVTGGLRRGCVHEWLTGDDSAFSLPPMSLLVHLADRSLEASPPGLLAIWIGRPCWPCPLALPAGLLARSVFVDAAEIDGRVWSADLALRAKAVGVVISDASGLGMSASRRLQLAASTGSAVGLLARPWRERGEVSAAWTRWRVEPEPAGMTASTSPRWAIDLLRCKGLQSSDEGVRRWCVQRDHETCSVSLVPDAGDRSASSAGSTHRRFA